MIRQELARGPERRASGAAAGLGDREQELDLGELCDRAGIDQALARALEEVRPARTTRRGGRAALPRGRRRHRGSLRRLAQFGIDARHIRTFKNSAGASRACSSSSSPGATLAQTGARKAGLEDLQALAEASQELSQLLFWRELRQLAER